MGQNCQNSGATLGFETKLWEAADALRNNMDAAEYKHVVLGLVFLKYISDAFNEKHAQLEAEKAQGADPEDADEYRAVNIFWVPPEARWSFLQGKAKQPTVGKDVDDAMVAIERDNLTLKGVLPKEYARQGLDKQRLGQLIDRVSDIGLGDRVSRSKDILGRVYEYFLSQFASAEGKKGRAVLYAAVRGPHPGRHARAVQRPGLRPVLWVRRHVRAVREVRRGTRRQDRTDQHLRAGVELYDLAAGQDESGPPGNRRQHHPRRQFPQRPASGSSIGLHSGQPAVQRQRLARRVAEG
jgi:hypothetical protein